MELEKLFIAAKEAANNAYAPYSNFKVGAAIFAEGKIYSGCNVENASYGATNCAERTAIFKAVSEGVKEFDKIAIYANYDNFITPCGICRQVMGEFFKSNSKVYLLNSKLEYKEITMEEVLPYGFKLTDYE